MIQRSLSFLRMIRIFSLFLALVPFSLRAGAMKPFSQYATIFTGSDNPEVLARILSKRHAKAIDAQNTNDLAIQNNKKVLLALPTASEKAEALIDANKRQCLGDSSQTVTSEADLQTQIASHDLAIAEAIPDAHSISGSSSASFPFQLANSLIYLQASLNGSKPLWMMLDTGSSVSVFDESVSKALGLRFIGEGDAYGPGQGSSQKLAFTSHATLRFAGAELDDQTVGTLPLDWFSREVGRSTDGFLGSNVFRNYVVEIDYANQVLRLHDPAAYLYSGAGQSVPLQFSWDSIPSVPAEILAPDGTSIAGIFLVDTGATTGLWLSKAFSHAHPELLAEDAVEVPSVIAVGGEVRSRVGQVPAIRLGGFVVCNPMTQFSQNISGMFAMPQVAGTIGAEFLRRFTVIFDYPHRQMILQSNANFCYPHE